MYGRLSGGFSTFSIAVVLLAGLALPCSAQTLQPRIWTHVPPPSGVTPHTLIKPLLTVNVGGPVVISHNPTVTRPYTGEDAAIDLHNAVIASGYQHDDIAVLFQNFGLGRSGPYDTAALAFHEDDALDSASPACTSNPDSGLVNIIDRTPWFEAGISETTSWVNAFVVKYNMLTNSSLSLRPSRFVFDTEYSIASCCETRWIQLFDLSLDDNHATSAPIPGYGLNTLDDLWSAQSLSYDCDLAGFSGVNREFTQWWKGVARQAEDAAMKAAVYDRFVAYGWDVITSNYAVSCRYDGINNRALSDGAHFQAADGYGIAWTGSASHQAPILYPSTSIQQTLTVIRENLENCINSFGGGHQDEMMPWVYGPGQCSTETSCGLACATCATRAKKGEVRQVFSLLRSKDTPEILLYNPQANAASNWADLNDLVDQVWMASIDSASITAGTQTGTSPLPDPATQMQLALSNTSVSIQSTTSGTPREVTVEVVFDTDFASVPDSFAIVIESTASISGVRAKVSAWNWSSSAWVDAVVDADVATSGYGNEWRCLTNPAQFIHGTTQQVKVRIAHTHPSTTFTSTFNLVQLLGNDEYAPLVGDVNSDGIVGLGDVGLISGAWNQTVPPASATLDIDRDGVVGLTDVSIVTTNWGLTGPPCR